MSELKPCPFCGGPVELEHTVGSYERVRNGRPFWGVVCRNTTNIGGTCAIQQIPSASEEAAIERWNRRFQPEANADTKDAGLFERLFDEYMTVMGSAYCQCDLNQELFEECMGAIDAARQAKEKKDEQ